MDTKFNKLITWILLVALLPNTTFAKEDHHAQEPVQATTQLVEDDNGDGVLYPEDKTGAGHICSVDGEFVKSIVNSKEFFCPMSGQKVAYWTLFLTVIGSIVTLEYFFGLGKDVKDWTNANSTPVMVALFSMDPLISMLNLMLAKYPDAAKAPDEESRQIPALGAEDVALVITAHNSSEVIQKNLRAALKHLKPEQIFVVDNANTATPSDNTLEKVSEVDPKINYIYQSIGNKTVAQYAGAKIAFDKGYKFVMPIDDDVRLPENFVFATNRIDDDVKCVAYPCRPVAPDGKPSILVDWQDIEYQNSDLAKLVDAELPHGAGSLWDVETFLKILRDHHDTVFYADDVKQGLALSRLGKKMVFCASTLLETDAPTSILGSKPNYWNQRVRSWEKARHIIMGTAVANLFLPTKQKTWSEAAIRKVSQFSMVYANLVDWAKIPVVVMMAPNPMFWAKTAGFMAAATIPPLAINYGSKLKNRPDLKINWKKIATYPAYKVLYNGVSVLGALRALFIYAPNHKTKPTIKELEESNDPRCAWLKASLPSESSESGTRTESLGGVPAPYQGNADVDSNTVGEIDLSEVVIHNHE